MWKSKLLCSERLYPKKLFVPHGFDFSNINGLTINGNFGKFSINCGTSTKNQISYNEKDLKISGNFGEKNEFALETPHIYINSLSTTPLGIHLPESNISFYFGKNQLRGKMVIEHDNRKSNFEIAHGEEKRFHLELTQLKPYMSLGYVYSNNTFEIHGCIKNKTFKVESYTIIIGDEIIPQYLLMSLNARQGRLRVGFISGDHTLLLHWTAKVPIHDVLIINTYTGSLGMSTGIKKSAFNGKYTLTGWVSPVLQGIGLEAKISENLTAATKVVLTNNHKLNLGFTFNFNYMNREENAQ